MEITITRASKATSGIPGQDAPGIAIEAQKDGSIIRLYLREGWGGDKMAVNGKIEPVDPAIMSAISIALEEQPVKLDMDYAEYLEWVSGSEHDPRYGLRD